MEINLAVIVVWLCYLGLGFLWGMLFITWFWKKSTWRHVFSLRCSKAAHPQIRNLMLDLLSQLRKSVPVLFDQIDGGENV